MTTPNPSPKRPVSKPKDPLPKGAIDTHAHVFGPFDKYPLTEVRRYEPPLAPPDDYFAMLDEVGFSGGVLVHAAAKGFDNSNVADAVMMRPDWMRGIGVVPPETEDADLLKLHAMGMRGLRFTDNGRPPPPVGSINLGDIPRFLPVFRDMKWQAVVWAKCDLILGQAKLLRDGRVPVVIDHMGFFEPHLGVKDQTFKSFLSLLRDGDFWVKMTPGRTSQKFGDYTDLRPFHDALLETIPDRALYGGDWPFISNDDAPPDAGKMVDLFDSWTNDKELRQKIFVDNPAKLYGFGAVGVGPEVTWGHSKSPH